MEFVLGLMTRRVLANQSVLHRPQLCCAARRYPDLRVRVLDVAVCGFRRDEEPLVDLTGHQTLCREAEYLDLAPAMPAGVLLPAVFRGTVFLMTGRCQHRVGRATVD